MQSCGGSVSMGHDGARSSEVPETPQTKSSSVWRHRADNRTPVHCKQVGHSACVQYTRTESYLVSFLCSSFLLCFSYRWWLHFPVDPCPADSTTCSAGSSRAPPVPPPPQQQQAAGLGMPRTPGTQGVLNGHGGGPVYIIAGLSSIKSSPLGMIRARRLGCLCGAWAPSSTYHESVSELVIFFKKIEKGKAKEWCGSKNGVGWGGHQKSAHQQKQRATASRGH